MLQGVYNIFQDFIKSFSLLNQLFIKKEFEKDEHECMPGKSWRD